MTILQERVVMVVTTVVIKVVVAAEEGVKIDIVVHMVAMAEEIDNAIVLFDINTL